MYPLTLAGHERPLTSLKYSRDCDLLFSAGKDGIVGIYCTADGRRLGTYQEAEWSSVSHNNKSLPAVNDIDVDYNTQFLVVGDANQTLRIFDVLKGTVIQMMELNGPIRSLEWNRGNRFDRTQDKMLIASSPLMENERSETVVGVFEWNIERCELDEHPSVVLDIYGHNLSKVELIRWGPMDETIITTHNAMPSKPALDAEVSYICVWDSFTGKLITKFEGHSQNTSSLGFCPDRLFMLSTSRDCTAKMWNMTTMKEVTEIKTDRPLNAGQISPLFYKEAFDLLDSDATEVVRSHIIIGGGQDAKDVTTTGSREGHFEAQLWNLPLKANLGQIGGHIGPINVVAWRPDGKGFATGGEGGLIRLHEFDADYFEDHNRFP